MKLMAIDDVVGQDLSAHSESFGIYGMGAEPPGPHEGAVAPGVTLPTGGGGIMEQLAKGYYVGQAYVDLAQKAKDLIKPKKTPKVKPMPEPMPDIREEKTNWLLIGGIAVGLFVIAGGLVYLKRRKGK